MKKPPIASAQADLEHQKVMAALNTILASESFVTAPQMSAFLRYVVEQAAQGRRHHIRPYNVAVEALGKPESFDSRYDPALRVLAGKLCKALQAFNEKHPNQEVTIHMNPGSYVPDFRIRSAKSHGEPRETAICDESDEFSMTAANGMFFGEFPTPEIASDNDRVRKSLQAGLKSPHYLRSTAEKSRSWTNCPYRMREDATVRSDSADTIQTPAADDISQKSRRLLTHLLQHHALMILAIAMLLSFLIGLSLPYLTR